MPCQPSKEQLGLQPTKNFMQLYHLFCTYPMFGSSNLNPIVGGLVVVKFSFSVFWWFSQIETLVFAPTYVFNWRFQHSSILISDIVSYHLSFIYEIGLYSLFFFKKKKKKKEERQARVSQTNCHDGKMIEVALTLSFRNYVDAWKSENEIFFFFLHTFKAISTIINNRE